MMRNLLLLLFWVGVFQVVREWRYSRKHGLAITRTEKLVLASTLILWIPLQLAIEQMGLSVESASGLGLAAIGGLFFNAWVMRRRFHRAASPKT